MECRRCAWAKGELMQKYHDEEWGVPIHDDQKLYEMLLLEAFQAGLSWYVVLSKRENFRQAFDGFDAHKIAAYGQDKIEALAQNKGLIRSKNKIGAAVVNARIFLTIQQEFDSFDAYLASFTGGKTLVNTTGEFRTTSPLSDTISKDLRRRGMKYMGSVTVYSYLQAVGVTNDHEAQCFMHPQQEIKIEPSVIRME